MPNRTTRRTPSTAERAVPTRVIREQVAPHLPNVDLVWLDSVPPEMRRAFQPYAEWMCRFAPRWLAELCVEMDEEPPARGVSLYVTCDPEYNRANVVICAGWFSQDVTARRLDVTHELIHVHAARVQQWVDDVKAHEWKADDDMRAVRTQQYRHADESMTEDLTRLLATFLPPPTDAGE